jgi:hypothetical protein
VGCTIRFTLVNRAFRSGSEAGLCPSVENGQGPTDRVTRKRALRSRAGALRLSPRPPKRSCPSRGDSPSPDGGSAPTARDWPPASKTLGRRLDLKNCTLQLRSAETSENGVTPGRGHSRIARARDSINTPGKRARVSCRTDARPERCRDTRSTTRGLVLGSRGETHAARGVQPAYRIDLGRIPTDRWPVGPLLTLERAPEAPDRREEACRAGSQY